jgi:hypothetical protein
VFSPASLVMRKAWFLFAPVPPVTEYRWAFVFAGVFAGGLAARHRWSFLSPAARWRAGECRLRLRGARRLGWDLRWCAGGHNRAGLPARTEDHELLSSSRFFAEKLA